MAETTPPGALGCHSFLLPFPYHSHIILNITGNDMGLIWEWDYVRNDRNGVNSSADSMCESCFYQLLIMPTILRVEQMSQDPYDLFLRANEILIL